MGTNGLAFPSHDGRMALWVYASFEDLGRQVGPSLQDTLTTNLLTLPMHHSSHVKATT